MISIDIDTKGLEELLQSLKVLKAEMPIAIKNGLDNEMRKTLINVQTLTPVDYGNLKRNWKRTGISKVGSELKSEIYNDLDYASYVEDGHWQNARFLPSIVDHRGKLRYKKGAKTGVMLTTKFIEGRHMLKTGISNFEERFSKEMHEYIKKVGMKNKVRIDRV